MPKTKYLVMDAEDGLSIHDAEAVESYGPQSAAKAWVEANDDTSENPEEREVKVYSPITRKWTKYTVLREWEPTYTADEGAECAAPPMVCEQCGADEGEACTCREDFEAWMRGERK